ncbi:MAG: DUF3870 domain-containing protein [Firmicutes bacterium]|nr:DUF3870 domain-containing protein [Bacillota bacterium]
MGFGASGPTESRTIFVTGYARIPEGITANQLYKVLGIGVEIDPRTEVIIDADCTLATTVGKSFFKKLVVGYDLGVGIEPLVQRFERRYHGSAQKAIIAALRVIEQRYIAYKTGCPVEEEE